MPMRNFTFLFILCTYWLNHASAAVPTGNKFSGSSVIETGPYVIEGLYDLQYLSDNDEYGDTLTETFFFDQTENIAASRSFPYACKQTCKGLHVHAAQQTAMSQCGYPPNIKLLKLWTDT